MRYAVLFFLLATPAAADEREVFYGTWGTAKQCSGAPLKPGGTVKAEPFKISSDWLGQGQIWCRLKWFPTQLREGGVFTAAQAQCGEDSVRDHYLRMELSGDTLTLRWNFLLSNGPLTRCPGS